MATAAAPNPPPARRVLVPVAHGSEEIETVSIVDTLRRAGAQVTLASVEPELTVKCSRGVQLVADASLESVASQEWDFIALPGGMPGSERLRDSAVLLSLLKRQQESKRFYGAICAAPAVALLPHGLLDGVEKATCHPGFTSRLPTSAASTERVVTSGNVITSQAPGTALEFALAIIAALYGQAKADEVGKPMVVASGKL